MIEKYRNTYFDFNQGILNLEMPTSHLRTWLLELWPESGAVQPGKEILLYLNTLANERFKYYIPPCEHCVPGSP